MGRRKAYRFDMDPRKRGLEKVLGELESQIMELLWIDAPATVHDVHQKLKQSRGVAYTTVMTVMSRLAEKGLLKRKKQGYSYLYQPVCSRREFSTSIVGSVLNGLIRDFGSPVVQQFLDRIEEDEALMEELELLIERRKGMND